MNIRVTQLQNGWLISNEFNQLGRVWDKSFNGVFIAETKDIGPAIEKLCAEYEEECEKQRQREVEQKMAYQNQMAMGGAIGRI